MTIGRRDLIGLSLGGLYAPQAFAQTRPVGPARPTSGNPIRAEAAPVWPPPEHFALWPGPPPGAPSPLPTPAPEITGKPGLYRDIWMRGTAYPEVGIFRAPRPDGRAVLIAPGGGYSFTSLRGEGTDVAQALNGFGITAFVLSYRLPGEGWANRADVPLQDAQRAMRLIRANARQYGIDPLKLGVIGFSAGGHLAGSLVVRHDLEVYRAVDAADRHSAQPAFAALMYAVSNMDAGRSRGGSRANLMGPSPLPSLEARYAIDRGLRPGSSPLFICHAQDDQTVPVVNGIDLLMAAQRNDVAVEAHILRRGGHGFGVRLPARAPGALWPQLFDRWMADAVTPIA